MVATAVLIELHLRRSCPCPAPTFELADASLPAWWNSPRARALTHIYAFDPAFPGKDIGPGHPRAAEPGFDVLGGIARGLNRSPAWRVLISFQPPRVWAFKGLRDARLAERVTGMSMRVSCEQKTAFVYVREAGAVLEA